MKAKTGDTIINRRPPNLVAKILKPPGGGEKGLTLQWGMHLLKIK